MKVRRPSRLPHRVLLVVLGVLTGVATGVAFANDPTGREPFPAAAPAPAQVVGLLGSGPTPDSQRVAATLGQSDFATMVRLVPERVRDAEIPGPNRVFAAPSDHGWLCVVLEHRALDYVPATACQPLADMATRPLTVAVSSGDRSAIAGLAPDGYTEATSGGTHGPVIGNAFVLEGVGDAGAVEVRGPGLPPLRSSVE